MWQKRWSYDEPREIHFLGNIYASKFLETLRIVPQRLQLYENMKISVKKGTRPRCLQQNGNQGLLLSRRIREAGSIVSRVLCF